MPAHTTARPRPAVRSARRGSTRVTGMLVAVGVGLAAVGVVGYFALARPRPEDAPRAPRPQGTPKDLAALAKRAQAGDKPGEPLAGSAEGVRIELADKKDPSRVASVLLAKSVRPLEGRRAAVTEPAALIYLHDGRTLRIKASSGLFSSFSADQAPERGTFEGGVKMMVYAPLPKPPTRETDWDALTPVAVADFGDKFDFDLTFGQADVPGAFSLTAEGLTLRGTQARFVLDDAGSAVRSIAIARDIELELTPGAGGEPKTDPATPAGPAADPKAPAAAAEALYRISMPGTVGVVSGSGAAKRTVEATKADGFVRLVNNRLRPGAVVKLDSGPDPLATSPLDRDEAAPAPARESFSLKTPGPLEIKASPDAPEELAKNDVFVRLHGDVKPVTFADAGSKASGKSPLVEYGATRGDLTLLGDRPGAVQLKGDRDGRLDAEWLTINLPTRIGQSRGKGGVFQPIPPGADDPEPRERRVEWGEQADFSLGEGRKAWELAWAQLDGDVTGTDGRGTFAAEGLKAELLPKAQLKKVAMSGGAGARDGKGSSLNADAIDVVFEPREGGKTDPTLLTAKGTVEARDRQRVLSAGLLESTIIRDGKGSLAAKDVVAKEFVNYAGEDRLAVLTPELHADVQAQTLQLVGEDSTITQGSSQIFGSLFKLDGLAGTLHVDSPGRFETAGSAGEGLIAAKATWTTSMSFDDKTGVLEAVGDADARGMPDEFTIDRLHADRVVVVTRRNEATASQGDSGFAPAFKGDREIVRMTAEAAPGKPPASVESRRYDGEVSLESTDGRRADRLQYLEGGTIIADNEAGTLSVPGAGKSLILDRRAQGEPDKAELPAAPGPAGLTGMASGFRGTALFEWRDAMDFARVSGELGLRGAVKITNDRPVDKTVVFIQTDSATARLAGFSDEDKKNGVQAQLARAEATGGVFGRFKTGLSERELNADHAVFDGPAGTLRIDAKEGGEVSLFDVSTATPLKAAELLWDLAKDRVEVVRPSPVTTPK